MHDSRCNLLSLLNQLLPCLHQQPAYHCHGNQDRDGCQVMDGAIKHSRIIFEAVLAVDHLEVLSCTECRAVLVYFSQPGSTAVCFCTSLVYRQTEGLTYMGLAILVPEMLVRTAEEAHQVVHSIMTFLRGVVKWQHVGRKHRCYLCTLAARVTHIPGAVHQTCLKTGVTLILKVCARLFVFWILKYIIPATDAFENKQQK